MSKIAEGEPLKYLTVLICDAVIEVGYVVKGNNTIREKIPNKHRLVDVTGNVVIVKVGQWCLVAHR